ncbi:MAG: hypothetical protein ABI718_14850 [Acidobacteriota bacterium]
MRLRFLLVLILSLAVAPVFAQSIVYKRFLLPTVLPPEGVPGSFGSLWKTSLLMRNDADEAVSITYYAWGCTIGLCPPPPPTPKGLTFHPRIYGLAPAYGVWMRVDERFADQVHFELRVQDQTRQSAHFGTDIPVVAEDHFASTVSLLGIPVTADFRVLLRIYGTRPGRVRLRYYRINPVLDLPFGADVLLRTDEVPLIKPPENFSPDIDPDTAVVPLTGLNADQATVAIDALDGQRIWGYASITHNETQNVTLITPN